MGDSLTELRILVISPNPLARVGLAAMLGDFSGCQVVGQLASGDDLAEPFRTLAPDVILWDLGWETTAALETLRAFTSSKTLIPVVALLPDEEDFLAAQANGILLQDSSAERIVAALIAAVQGLTVLDPAFMLPNTVPSAAPEALNEALTKRESEVLQLLAQGLANKTIAHQLGVSEHTIKFHVNAIMGKLGVQSRTEAVVKATKLGLIIL